MDLKKRIVESTLSTQRVLRTIERKIELKNEGLLEPYSLFNTIRRMKIIERLFNGKELG
jgi:hypothetical protein